MTRRRLVLGGILLGLSLVPWAVAAVVPFLGLPASQTAGAIGILLVGGEIVGALAVLVLGREAVARLRRRWFRRSPGNEADKT